MLPVVGSGVQKKQINYKQQGIKSYYYTTIILSFPTGLIPQTLGPSNDFTLLRAGFVCMLC